MFLIFGPDFLKNPFLAVIFLFIMFFIFCWLFGYIHPNKWGKKQEQNKEDTYVKQVPRIDIQALLQEQTPDVDKFICPYCGVLQDQGTKYCTKCGQNLRMNEF
ncbi:MAG: hypothetical protein ACTSPS_04345 [Promethearchaeota archaeon]